MKSGLDGRNNWLKAVKEKSNKKRVSMKSGLDGRNNNDPGIRNVLKKNVSMKSGLDGRNNLSAGARWKSPRLLSQ